VKGVTFPPSIIQRVVARRGTKHIFSDLDPKRTALVVVDLQNAFMDDEVGHAVCPAARDIVPAVNRLAGAVRTSGGAVFWIKNTFDESCLTEWSVMQDISTPAMRVKRAAAMSEATKGHELWPTLDVRPEDEFASGHLPNALNIPLSQLERRLAELPPDQEIVAYCRGPWCVLSFEAVALLRQRGYRARRMEDGFPEWKTAGLPTSQEIRDR